VSNQILVMSTAFSDNNEIKAENFSFLNMIVGIIIVLIFASIWILIPSRKRKIYISMSLATIILALYILYTQFILIQEHINWYNKEYEEILQNMDYSTFYCDFDRLY